jgi:glutamate synthase domain-containing protein 1
MVGGWPTDHKYLVDSKQWSKQIEEAMRQQHDMAAAQKLQDYIRQQRPDIGNVDPAQELLRMLGMRLRVKAAETFGFEYITAHQIDETKVVLFIVHNKQPVVLEDDGALFPSDQLVSQLRLMLG